ncbi:hypothetical protein [Dactylosporangium fulvum]|uniref:Uncharacterized protein n=1 Tax=Dactylosporangium fulvum TaxID=53359 RepID=A0ABY5W3V3_9ACTN|nr:hypothetical protein [Dactylosporangium fulvum]UWP84693.1 hypothetical protein Dfulv_10840 [Dactylosporangium fulvum]
MPAQSSPTGAFPAQPAYGPPPAAPPSTGRNPLLIPGLVLGVVCLVLIGAVIVYAASGGGEATPVEAAQSPSRTPPAAASPSVTGAADVPGAEPSASAGSSAVPGATPSASTDSLAACVLGVWLEEKHDQQVTVRNTGVFPFHSSGTYQRYGDTGRAVFDYGDGVHMTGTNGTSNFDYVFSGFISYSFNVENGMLVFASPRPSGTETFIRNGRQDFHGSLAPHMPQPLRINCGPVAMSLTNDVMTIQLKRTSSVQ